MKTIVNETKLRHWITYRPKFVVYSIIIWDAIFSYGIIAAPITEIAVVNNTKGIAIQVFLASLITIILNYLLLKNLIANKNPWIISCIIVSACIIVFSPFFFNAKQSLINYQRENPKREIELAEKLEALYFDDKDNENLVHLLPPPYG